MTYGLGAVLGFGKALVFEFIPHGPTCRASQRLQNPPTIKVVPTMKKAVRANLWLGNGSGLFLPFGMGLRRNATKTAPIPNAI
jgi:hypothetical protein